LLVHTQAIQGISLIDDGQPIYCESCEYAKTTRKVIKKEREGKLAKAFSNEIHTDVWTSPLNSLGGRKYYITFTDDHSCYTITRLLKAKSEVFQAYKDFMAWALTQHSTKIKQLHSDRGSEYIGDKFNKYLNEQGTEHRATTHDTPQHNGVAELLNRRLGECIRAVLHQSGLPKNLWGEAINHITWLKNCTLTQAISNITPHEKLYGEKPNLARMPEWGQHVWVHTNTGSKLDTQAIEGHWVGYNKDSTHAHWIYMPNKNSIVVERDVRFVPTNITVHAGPGLTSGSTPPALIPPPPTLPPATPLAPATTRPMLFNTPLLDSEGEEEQGEGEDGWEDED
jgi:transposase InsO family protein